MEAVQEYVDGKDGKTDEEPKNAGSKNLFGEPLPPPQKRLF